MSLVETVTPTVLGRTYFGHVLPISYCSINMFWCILSRLVKRYYLLSLPAFLPHNCGKSMHICSLSCSSWLWHQLCSRDLSWRLALFCVEISWSLNNFHLLCSQNFTPFHPGKMKMQRQVWEMNAELNRFTRIGTIIAQWVKRVPS